MGADWVTLTRPMSGEPRPAVFRAADIAAVWPDSPAAGSVVLVDGVPYGVAESFATVCARLGAPVPTAV